jgi:hypothetical protein
LLFLWYIPVKIKISESFDNLYVFKIEN